MKKFQNFFFINRQISFYVNVEQNTLNNGFAFPDECNNTPQSYIGDGGISIGSGGNSIGEGYGGSSRRADGPPPPPTCPDETRTATMELSISFNGRGSCLKLGSLIVPVEILDVATWKNIKNGETSEVIRNILKMIN